ncbi:lipocalin family protein [Parabacteroides chinchillae]|uniref:Lipocalin/cytosolic fatty-acid binding domain-containing protein n=1 Tax=Parabacteroides chinchillae TaxID=871327 RepID=A0A8G2BYZ9_9BACT|nr:lipocalin family protein [Parabacteroides chinchillae]SEG26095.1 apolipoprotein D and lipocalin family protein/hypothetical protein [Parabacteroides chinchillae]
MNLKLTIFTYILLMNTSCIQRDIDKTTIKTIDIDKYMGKWFEIARIDHRFEHNLVGVTAQYTKLPNGKIQVINSGYWNDFSGDFKTAKGVAKITNASEPGKLKVSFFLWFYAEYNIMELDSKNYSYALIGSNTSEYLWILSRTPQLPEETIRLLLNKAEQRGYDISIVKRIKQKE